MPDCEVNQGPEVFATRAERSQRRASQGSFANLELESSGERLKMRGFVVDKCYRISSLFDEEVPVPGSFRKESWTDIHVSPYSSTCSTMALPAIQICQPHWIRCFLLQHIACHNCRRCILRQRDGNSSLQPGRMLHRLRTNMIIFGKIQLS